MDGVQNGSCLPKSTISLCLDSGPASLAAGCTKAGVPDNRGLWQKPHGQSRGAGWGLCCALCPVAGAGTHTCP